MLSLLNTAKKIKMLRKCISSMGQRTFVKGPQVKHFPPQMETMLPEGSFNGKVAFITGGGTGLGKGMTKKFVDLGATVVISSRKQNVLEATADEIMSTNPAGKVVPIACDVRDPTSVSEAINRLQDLTGKLPSICINNAAGNFISPTERLSPNAFKTIVEIVLLGSANVTLEVGKRLIEADQGLLRLFRFCRVYLIFVGCAFLGITTPYARTGSGYVTPSACSKVHIIYKLAICSLITAINIGWS